MRAGLVATLAVLLFAGPVRAETLGDLLRARGVAPPAAGLPGLGEPMQAREILDDERDLLIVYGVGERAPARLYAARFDRASRAWQSAPLEWSRGGLDPDSCRGGLAVERFADGFVVSAHINPSAECTIILGRDLGVRAVLAGWPLAALADGRIVYQRNQIHFASFHPVALAVFDPRLPADVPLYPKKPYQAIRVAHLARMRAVYTAAWCSARNHPCDPDVFDEHVSGEVVTGARGDALAFVMAWDNTTGWSDAERWGRLESFREVRRALARWGGQGAPPTELFEALSAGLARVRNLRGQTHVKAALGDDRALRDLVVGALAAPPVPGQDARSWLVALDVRWADPETWRRLSRAVEVPDEFTEVVYVYTGLDRPETLEYREMLRRDFEARFGAIPLRRALEPAILRQIFGAGLK